MALRIGQHVDTLHAADSEAFVRVLFVENPIRSFRAGAQITLGSAPFFIQHVFHLVLKCAAQDLAEQHAEQHQQDAEEDYIAQSQTETQSASPAQGFARCDHISVIIEPV